MRAIHLLILLTFIFYSANSQGPVGSWEDHLPYQNMKKIVAATNEVYGATDYAIAIYDKKYEEVKKLSRVHGLTESTISTIAYSSNSNTLLIAYNSTNLDLYSEGRIVNVPDIYHKYVSGKKEITKIRTFENFAYILTSFGIIILDIEDAEIYDSWNPSVSGNTAEVYDIAFLNNKVYAATSEGLMVADKDNPALTYFGNWSTVPGFNSPAIIDHMVSLDNNLYLSRPSLGSEKDSLIRYDGSNRFAVSQEFISPVKSLETGNNQMIVTYATKIDIYNDQGLIQRTVNDYGWGSLSMENSIISDNELYIADNNFGIILEKGAAQYISIIVPGPYFNNASNIFSSQGNVYISGGLVDNAWNNTWTGYKTLLFEDRQWWTGNFEDSWDVMRIRPFPNSPDKIAVSTWGSGVYIVDNHQISDHFTESNSPLENIIPDLAYVRICGLSFDRDNNLWMTQSGVENSIKILKPDNSWIVLPFTIDAPTIGDIIITNSNKKWIILPRGHGLYVFDDNNTPENFGDDTGKKITVKDQDGKTLNNIYSICEDLDGNIWIGTDQGPAVYYNPDLVFDNDINCYRIKISRNDGSGLADYLLGTETINTIAVDGGNNKWFGTNNSGVFNVTPDARELINSFNTENSPILSNAITSIGIEGESGEIWIGTDVGIITYRGNSTEGEGKLDKAFAFPNPVAPDFKGSLIITGLVRDTNVKIVDISGNLVYETISMGGQASWDLTTYNGNRVASGVYLALCATSDGSESTVVKFLVIR